MTSPLTSIKIRPDFLRIRGGQKWSGTGFLIETKTSPTSGGPPRFGFTVTKKLGNAVVRNRIRRRLKEAAKLAADGHAKPGYDYVVVARKAAFDMPFEQMTADMEAALKRVHKVATPKRPQPKLLE